MYEGELYFILGIACFWGTQTCYIIHFFPLIRKVARYKVILVTAMYLIYFVAMLRFLIPGLGDLTIPVSLYALTITVFGIVATLAWLHFKTAAITLVLGASLFIISDSMIALQKFVFQDLNLGFMVMLTYILAQGLIVLFEIRRPKLSNNNY